MPKDKTLIHMQKLQEKQLLDAIHAIFKKSDLLLGQPPCDKIYLPKPCSVWVQNLIYSDEIDAQIGKTLSSTKKRRKKKTPKKGHES